jgi:sensor domain CHASE-containing protein
MNVHSRLVMLVEGIQLLSAVPSVTSDYAIPVILE